MHKHFNLKVIREASAEANIDNQSKLLLYTFNTCLFEIFLIEHVQSLGTYLVL